MKDRFIKLHNTLSLIEVKGQNAKIMGECLTFIEKVIEEIEKEEDEDEPS